MKRSLRILGICLAVAPSTASMALASTSSVDVRAQEAFQLFDAFCVREAGSRDRAEATLGGGNALANRLPEDAAKTLQGNRPGGVAWAMRSPSGGQLLLGYTGSGICEVRIAEADEAAVVEQFTSFAKTVDAQGQFGKPDVRKQDDARITFRSFGYERSGRKANIAITTADKRIGAQQHLITFAFVQ